MWSQTEAKAVVWLHSYLVRCTPVSDHELIFFIFICFLAQLMILQHFAQFAIDSRSYCASIRFDFLCFTEQLLSQSIALSINNDCSKRHDNNIAIISFPGQDQFLADLIAHCDCSARQHNCMVDDAVRRKGNYAFSFSFLRIFRTTGGTLMLSRFALA